MSQLLRRISSSLGKKERLCFSELRWFSTAAATPSPSPFVLCNETNARRSRVSDGARVVVVDINLYDPRKDETVEIPDQTLPEELYPSMKIGSSRGWVGVKDMRNSNVLLTNIFNPSASVSSHKVITLPPLQDSEAHISSISLSASPDHEDCVVAATTTRPSLYLCRPGDSEWIHTKIPHFNMQMMYSARDRQFYLRSWKNEENGAPLDLFKTSSGFPQVSLYQSFPNSDILQVSSPNTDQYLVESPSGESFIVCWCNKLANREEVVSPDSASYVLKPTGFAVFRQDHKKKIASYTDDIGDLCIFLGKGEEAFCVSASEYPGLKPNSVYYARYDTGLGFYDLSSNTLHEVTVPAALSRFFLCLAPLH
ncbi:unnamed protein product [Arabidopsis lyrata]|uniref:Predicted protein n=1 Tax=Arabidopsis lyrata subsp. lyrata TaxID=81972 RepID=D7MVD6_ARALL|nr:uncharacterized protein LOC9299346 [Arabidopsis lyrata subsp. lyrata]EFH39429.1 predicted protein [Arabidopsis lyrata subsp. lyrata]CAH8276959.1 unnamed protein product [Arabidopsis lyrata]|eukprot:XP_002863170.1 uncharacterized protein LOC9299346 [Arabidopsis lyrata subsp. lyrata]